MTRKEALAFVAEEGIRQSAVLQRLTKKAIVHTDAGQHPRRVRATAYEVAQYLRSFPSLEEALKDDGWSLGEWELLCWAMEGADPGGEE